MLVVSKLDQEFDEFDHLVDGSCQRTFPTIDSYHRPWGLAARAIPYHILISNLIYNTRRMGFYLPSDQPVPHARRRAVPERHRHHRLLGTTAGTVPRRAGPGTHRADTARAKLLTALDAGVALGDDDVVVSREVSAPWDDSAHFANGPNDSGTNLGCLAIAGAAQRACTPEPAGPPCCAVRCFASRRLPRVGRTSPPRPWVLFPDAQAAGEFCRRAGDAWAGCANRELAVYAQQLAPDQVWQIGPVSSDSNMLTVARTQRSPLQWSCQRALSVRGNVAIDVEACDAGGPTDAAAAITAAIGDRLPAA